MKVLVKMNSGKDTLAMTNVNNMEVIFNGDFYELHLDERVIDSSITSVHVRYGQRIAYHPSGADEGVYMGECGTHYSTYETLYDMISDMYESNDLDNGYFDIKVDSTDTGRELIITFVDTGEIIEHYLIDSYADTMYSYYGQDEDSEAMDATTMDKVMTSIEKARLHREEFIENYKKHLLINK